MMKKILLINAHFEIEKLVKGIMPPMGLAYIAGVLEKEGFEVSILDLFITKNPLKVLNDMIRKNHPEITGISFASANRFQAFQIAKTVKEIDENILVVVGGPHATFASEDILKNVREVDVVAKGEGEFIMLDIAKGKDLKDIPGISYRKNGKIFHNSLRSPIKNLDILPLPAYNLLDMGKYNFPMGFLEENYKAMTISTMRGCPYGCNFCSCTAMWGAYPRTFSAEKVIENMELLMEKYGCNTFYFTDETFTLHKNKCTELCEGIIENNLNIQWMTDVRVNEVSKNLLKLMRKAGCYMVAYGVESGNQKIIDMIGKRITLKQVLDCTKMCGELEIKRKAFFTYGLPGDTPETIYQTYSFRNKLNAEVKPIGVITVFPGTKVEHMAMNNGCLPRDFSWSRNFFESYHMIFATPSTIPIFSQPHLSKGKLSEIHMRYNVETKPIAIRLKRALTIIKSPTDIKALINYGRIYLKEKGWT